MPLRAPCPKDAVAPAQAGSMARYLVLSILSLVTVFWLAGAAITTYKAMAEVSHLLDKQLIYAAYFVHGTIPMLKPESESEFEEDHDHEERRDSRHERALSPADQIIAQLLTQHGMGQVPGHILLQIFDHEKLRYRSSGAPSTALTQEVGFSEVSLPHHEHSQRYRVFSLSDGAERIIVATTFQSRNDIAHEFAEGLLVPLAIFLPLLAIWIVFLLRRSFRVFHGLNHELQAHDLHSDATPIGQGLRLPQEIAPLVQTLNELLQTVGQQIKSERAFTANAAHELRTPLAALSSQLHVVTHARDAAERDTAIAHAQNALKRATHLINSLLLLARVDNPEVFDQVTLHAPCTLLPVLQTAVAENLSILNQHSIEVSLESTLAPETQVQAHPELLLTLLNNLIRNAALYAYPGCATERTLLLSVQRDAQQQIVVGVQDVGRGVPEAEREAVLKRFYRRTEGRTSSAIGAGLGLAIAATIAKLFGEGLRLIATREDASYPGLSVFFSLTEVLPSRAPETKSAMRAQSKRPTI